MTKGYIAGIPGTGGGGGGTGTPDNTTEGRIPVKQSGDFNDSAISQDTSNVIFDLPILAPSIDVLPGTVTIGSKSLKDAGENFTTTNKTDGDIFYPVWINDTIGIPKARATVGVRQVEDIELSKVDIRINPIWSYQTTADARIVDVTFEVDTTITNVIGEVYRNGVAFYRAELGTLAANVESQILLDSSTNNTFSDAFGGITYEFRLTSVDGDVRAKGSNPNLRPFFKVGFFDFVDNRVTIQSETNQRQIIRSGVKGNFSVAFTGGNTQLSITADDASGSFLVYFDGNIDIDNLDGNPVLVPDQVVDISNTPLSRWYWQVNTAGVIQNALTKASILNPGVVHLFEMTGDSNTFGQPGLGIPTSLLVNPRVTWSDMTLQSTLEAAGTAVDDLTIASTDDATMGINTTSFLMIANGLNYENSKLSPHALAVAGQDPQSWTYIDSSITTIPPINADVLLDATQWDNNGSLDPVGNNEATVQGVIVNNGNFIIMRGEILFANYDDALLNMDSVEFVIPDVIFNGVLVAKIALKGNATDSADPQEVTIRNLPSASGGTAGTDLFVTSSLIAPAFTDARFFSELGLADTQGFVITTSAPATVTIVNESVFGVPQDVHKLLDNGGGIATVSRVLTPAQWINIFNLDASYGGIIRLDSVDGDEGAFWGLGCLAADSPDASPDKRRFGLNFKKSLTTNELRVFGTDGNTLDIDVAGTSFDEYNAITLKITRGTPPTAEVFVNGVLIGSMTFNVHTGGTATECAWSSGSSGGVDRVTYMSNFGITIYESENDFVVGDSELNVDIAKTVIPPGLRDYTITLAENISGSAIGNAFEIVALNDGGTVTVNNENPANPQALFNGLKEVVVAINGVLITSGVNSVEGGNVYDFSLPPLQLQGDGNISLYNPISKMLIGSTVVDGTGSKLQVTGDVSIDDVVVNTTDNITIFYEGVLTAQFSLLETRNGVSLRYFGADKELVSINAALGTPDSGAFKGSMFLRVNGTQMSTNTTMSGASNVIANVPVNNAPFFLSNGDTIDIDYSDGDNVDALNLMVYLEVR